jgi:uncharacterized protein (DUF1778 family)
MLPARSRRATTHRNLTTSPKSERFGVRVTKFERELLDEASRATRTSVSDFVVMAATEAAEQVLADRTSFRLPPEKWAEFARALDAAPRQLPRLRQLLETPTVLDEA